jgi:hypothetical protein
MPERLVLCGREVRAEADSALHLALDGRSQNITLKLEDVSKRLVATVPELLIDLVPRHRGFDRLGLSLQAW